VERRRQRQMCIRDRINTSYLNLYSYLNMDSEFHPPTFIS
jgi:hypothetical protein